MKLNSKDSSASKERRSEESLGEVSDEMAEEVPMVAEDCSPGTRVNETDHEDLTQGRKNHGKEKKSKLGMKKKRKREKRNEVDDNNEDQIHTDEHADDGMVYSPGRLKSDHTKSPTDSYTTQHGNSEMLNEASNMAKMKNKKSKKQVKRKKNDFDIVESKSEEKLNEVDEEEVEEIPSVDEDSSRGLKKWLIKYKESRPGLKILQERIDDFITTHEEQQERERKERETLAAEGGWTVVVHHKGRKKTTESETGVTVGSVAQAAVLDNMGKKKGKEVPLDFYRFQRREAQRNELMLLRSKFEQDKKRIQQLRAARKFRPY